MISTNILVDNIFENIGNTIYKYKYSSVSAVIYNLSLEDTLRFIGCMYYASDIKIYMEIPEDSEYKVFGINTNRAMFELLDRWITNEYPKIHIDKLTLLGIQKIYSRNLIIKALNGTTQGKNSGAININLESSTSFCEIVGSIRMVYMNYGDRRIDKDLHILGKYIDSIEDNLKNNGNKHNFNLLSRIQRALESKIDLFTDRSPNNVWLQGLYNINRYHIASRNSDIQMLSDVDKFNFEYQTDGVNGVLSILMKYGICYLADSVGLGKTIVALRVIQKTGYRVVVVVPTVGVKVQWESLVESANIQYNVRVILNSYTAIKGVNDSEYQDIQLVIFDEAHNFKSGSKRYDEALELCAGAKVLLLGATPTNNGVSDFESQLMLGLDPELSYDFGVGKLGEYFKGLKAQLPNKSDTVNYRIKQEEIGRNIRKNIISKIMIRRTRSDIKKYYKFDFQNGKLVFPEISEPEIVRYEYPGSILAETLDILSGFSYKHNIKYSAYRNCDINAINISDLDENRSSTSKNPSIAGIIRVLLVKLLDSSPLAFCSSILSIKQKTEALLLHETDSNLQLDYISDIKTLEYLINIWEKQDIKQIKMKKLVEILNRHNGEKIVIFTEYIDTLTGIVEYLHKMGYRVLGVDGKTAKDKNSLIVSNFSNCKNSSDEYDILVATDILSEGINLNRASVAINYDITWNPMRIIQRVGRLNRIDSVCRQIHIYNFFPCDTLDSAILSESNIVSKYVLANMCVGIDENYLTPDIIEQDTLLAERESVVSRITSSIIEDETIDFKTVQFRYAEEAYRVFQNTKLEPKMTLSCVNKTVSNKDVAVYALYTLNNNIIAISNINGHIEFIDGNDVLDVYNRYKDYESSRNIPNKAFKLIDDAQNYIRKHIDIGNKLSGGSKDFYLSLCRLGEQLSNGYETGEISESVYRNYNDKLGNITDNLIINYIKSNLCSKYNKTLCTEIQGESDIVIKLDALFSIVNKKFMCRHSDIDRNSQLKCICLLLIV